MPSDDSAAAAHPEDWPDAKDYFERFSDGRFDADQKVSYLYPIADVRASRDGERLYVGRAGQRGIEFVFRPGTSAIWAYYPIDGDYDLKADDIDAFVAAWTAGEISV